MPTRAVLFDFDGVIADTENVHVAAWQRAFAPMGWDEPDETCAEAAEIDDRIFAAQVFARRKIEGADLDGWVARKQELAHAMFLDAPRIYPGVLELIKHLRGQTRLAIVSTADRNSIEAVLQAPGLSGAFELIIARQDVTNPKPDPESYRLALARLGLPAEEVVALEGSPTGLLAAQGAGIRAIAVGHRRPRGDWSGEAAFLADLRDRDAATAALDIDAG